jgi:hypothetical protein
VQNLQEPPCEENWRGGDVFADLQLIPGLGSRDFRVRVRSECGQKPVDRRASKDALLAYTRGFLTRDESRLWRLSIRVEESRELAATFDALMAG